jgi:hypothetical protein
MSLLIPQKISEDEILVHYIFDRNFKNKTISEEKLVSKDIFLPNKGGVSLQRNLYCKEDKCKEFAKKVAIGKVYIGFIVFRKSDFEKVKQNYTQNDRKEFDADIISKPLDEFFNYLPSETKVYIDTLGNPAHADLIYKNPALKDAESPNTAIRSFSRKLSKDCKLIIDSNPLSDTYDDVAFIDLI